MATRQRLVVLGTFVHCRTRQELDFFHNAALGVDADGKIAGFVKDRGDVGAARDELLRTLGWDGDEVQVVQAEEGQFFFPGFIDTHIHASQYANAGIFGKSTLMDWLGTYTFPLEASLSDLSKARRVYSTCIRRTLSHGTTTAAYFATIDVAATNLLADLCLAMGQRAFVGRVCMDARDTSPTYYVDESPAAGAAATMRTVEHMRGIDPRGELVTPILTPRFAPTCTAEGMRALAAVQRATGLPVQTHVSENADEIALVAARFPGAASYVGVYDEHGLLTPRTILAHGVHLSGGEAALVAARGAKVAHCPCSNTALASGVARVRWLWEQGVTVGLGTDMSGGYSPSMLDAARQAAMVSRYVAMGADNDAKDWAKLTVEEVLYLATRGGAEVVGLEGRIGGFEVGKDWDAQLVGLHAVGPAGLGGDGLDGDLNDDGLEDASAAADGNVDVFGWETWEDRVAKWLFNGDDRNTKRVWVRGRLVHSRR
ncbi:putative guanine deaminase [Escovopsis weberi]|uniref:Probable guanine deaminase n=1 Tax=Escovopsis weberi TaxID=150374 RepID=A0A0N0RTX1_ESCWE|nr:putative guanine deaminase [Escovopsis weberi]